MYWVRTTYIRNEFHIKKGMRVIYGMHSIYDTFKTPVPHMKLVAYMAHVSCFLIGFTILAIELTLNILFQPPFVSPLVLPFAFALSHTVQRFFFPLYSVLSRGHCKLLQ